MDDSPLSITASITGILTFLAAIVAFVYVRYNVLHNGAEEVRNISDSVSASVNEARKFETLTKLDARVSERQESQKELVIQIT